jgi:hypothetical protein
MALRLSQLVSDWGGFERLVATLHDTGTLNVQHNVSLVGNSGTPRQIDVVVRHKEGLYEHLIIVECKYWKENVSRLHVDALATAVRDLGASRGVIFSASGFQEGAIAAAKQEHIDLFRIRDFTEDDWGELGQVVTLFLQLYQPALANMRIEETASIGRSFTSLTLNIGGGPEQTTTPTVDPRTRLPGPLLESIIERSMHQSMRAATSDSFTISGGTECTVYAQVNVVIQPQKPFVIPHDEGALFIGKLSYDLGIRIDQKPLRFDRLEPYQFALIVEDCVRNVLSSASRARDESKVNLTPLQGPELPPDDVLRNGSVLKVYLKEAFPFEEMLGKPMIELPSARRENPPLSLDDAAETQ